MNLLFSTGSFSAMMFSTITSSLGLHSLAFGDSNDSCFAPLKLIVTFSCQIFIYYLLFHLLHLPRVFIHLILDMILSYVSVSLNVWAFHNAFHFAFRFFTLKFLFVAFLFLLSYGAGFYLQSVSLFLLIF